MSSSSSKAEVLAAEARGLARAARKHEVRGDLEEAHRTYAGAAKKFMEAGVISSGEAKRGRLDLARFFLERAKSMNRKADSSRQRLQVFKKPGFEIDEFVVAQKPDITFDGIGGLQEVKEALKREAIYPYTDKGRVIYEKYGRVPGTGILFYGPPGCGKTLLAKALAAESDATFLEIKSSKIMRSLVGESEEKIAGLFGFLRSLEKSILFLDELDTIVPRSGPSYVQRIKGEFLQQLDGVGSKKEDLLILGASNKPWRLDPALRRPGRLGKMIFIPPPDSKARLEIFRIHLADVSSRGMLEDDISFERLAALTEGFSGADIEQLCADAIDIPLTEALTGQNARKVAMRDFEALLSSLSRRKSSVSAWFVEASRAVRRAGEEEIYPELVAKEA